MTNHMTPAQACNDLRALTYDMCNFTRSMDAMTDKGLNAPDLLAAMKLNIEEQLRCLSALEPVVITFTDVTP